MLDNIAMFRNNTDSKKKIYDIPIDDILPNPYQPRKHFDIHALRELSQSIEQYGVLQPINVNKTKDGKYELVAGERRLRASKMAGLKVIPATIVDMSENDLAIVSLIENLQREDLNFFEEAQGYFQLISEHNLTQEELALKIGKNQSTIANKIRILKLPDSVKKLITEYNLTERHARALLKLPDEQLQIDVVKKIKKNNLNVKKTEELIEKTANNITDPKKKNKAKVKMFKDMRIYINTLNHAVKMLKKSGVKVEAKQEDKEDYIEYIVKIPKGPKNK